jgi:hypothetical protein
MDDDTLRAGTLRCDFCGAAFFVIFEAVDFGLASGACALVLGIGRLVLVLGMNCAGAWLRV